MAYNKNPTKYKKMGDDYMLGTRIRMLRKEHEWNQSQLADRIGVGRTTITEYERNKITPPYDKMVELAELFNVSIDFLTGASNSRKSDNVIDIGDIAIDLGLMIDGLNDPNKSFTFKGQPISAETKIILRDHLFQGMTIVEHLEQKMNTKKPNK